MTYSQAIDALLAGHDVTRPGKPYYMSRIGTSTVAAITKGTDVPWSGKWANTDEDLHADDYVIYNKPQ